MTAPKQLRVSAALRDEIVERMKAKGLTRAELRALLGTEKDSTARNWMTREIKPEYPVICTGHTKVYVIPTRPEQLELAKAASRENHRKAATLHRNTNVLDRWIIRTEVQQSGQGSIFEKEIQEINCNI